MKDRPKITRQTDGWRVTLPAYGFGQPARLGPFRTHRAALAHLRAHAAVGTSGTTERTNTPESRTWHEIWPVVFR
jgi:hypothetical protein